MEYVLNYQLILQHYKYFLFFQKNLVKTKKAVNRITAFFESFYLFL